MVFGKKKTLSERMKDILSEVELLPEEDQKRFWAEFEDKGDDKKVTTGEQIEEAKKDIAEKGPDSQTEKDRIDESVAMQEKADGNEDSQSAKDRVDESEGEEKYLEEKREEKTESEEEMTEEKGKTEETAEDKVNDALLARLAALEEKVAKMLESEAKEDFGMKASLPQGNESDEHYDAVMRGYAKGAWRNYK